MQDKTSIKLTEQYADLLEQAASMLEGLENDERNRGNCSTAEGAGCSAHAVRRLASALLAYELEIGQCLHQIQEPAAAPAAVAVPDAVTDEMVHAALRVQHPNMYRVHLRHPENGPASEARTEKEIDTARKMIAAALAATPAAAQTHAEAAAALCINSALHRIRAGNHSEAIPPLEHALRALAATPAADAQVPQGSYVSTSGELKPDVSVYSSPAADAPKANAGAVIAAPAELLERVIDSLSSFAGNKPHTEADMTAWEQLNDLLSAAPPAGWKLVPIEPTAEVLESAGAIDCDGTPATYKTLYMAMVGAALNPPPACDTPRYCNSVQRCTAMDEQRAAAAPVVLPEPVAFALEWTFDGEERGIRLYDDERHCRLDAESDGGVCSPLYTEQQVRALLAQAATVGLPEQAVEPSDAELIALNAGECFFSESPSKYPEAGHGTQYHAGAPGVIAFGRAAIALRAYPAARSQKFQQRVQPWMMACFGPEISADRMERNHRFLEEALELVQCLGCTASEAHQLVDYVYGRTWGDPAQEAGGVMVTLAALCQASSLDMHACGETELARIWTKVEAIRAKQAAKPKHSPLPMHVTEAQADARDAESDYQRGYRHGYNRRDAEVQGALL